MNIVTYINFYKPGVVLVLWEVCGVELVGVWRIELFAKSKKGKKLYLTVEIIVPLKLLPYTINDDGFLHGRGVI